MTIAIAVATCVPSLGAAEAEHDTHPWAFTSNETLEGRVPTARDFSRVHLARGSFGAFLRTLPIKKAGALVVDFRGAPLYDAGHHPNIAGVIDIDVGSRDLQQCADAVLRVNAEWRYGRGERDIAYHAASGLLLSYKRWLAGERVIVRDGKASLAISSAPRDDNHASLRAWLDDVFAYANTASLEREGRAVAFSDVAPGDYFVSRGAPYGHAVIVVDVAKDASGKTALLLAQGYMPAQSVQLLTPGGASPWFVVDENATEIKTPFWAPFSLRALRRLP